jgi:hypothetical protein
MGENQKRILEMLAAGKVSVAEAERLLSLLGSDPGPKATEQTPGDRAGAHYLHVVVEPKPGASRPEGDRGDCGHGHPHGRVNIRVPFSLIRAGMKFTSFIPADVSEKVNQSMKEKGIDFDLRHLKADDIEEVISALRDSEVNIEADDETVRVYAE